jgi:hypothetical protein|tara:strand:- start:11661 stop:12092 length:432 start_codon:yes stop_codon:yes gene_type:complete
MINQPPRPTNNFWIISILAILCNLIGVFAYIGQSFMSENVMKLLSESEQKYFHNLPTWVTAAFASAVFAGLFGSVGLLLRKKIVYPLFLFSLISLIVHQNYNFFIQNDIQITGLDLILPLATIFIGIFLVWFSSKMNKIGVLT